MAGSRPRKIAYSAVLLAAVSIVAALILPLSSPVSAVAVDDLEDEYPDADCIIAQGERSSVIVIRKVPGSDGEWKTTTVSANSSLVVSQLSDVSGSLNVVMVGGTLSSLTLVQTDVTSGVSPIDVHFTMEGGSVSDLCVLSVPSSLEGSLSKSYTLMFGPLGTVDLDLIAGDIGDLVPTEDMVSVSYMEVTIGSGMTIDRMMTSGTNGRYGEIQVYLRGGNVGYMANQKSVVGTLSYDMESGSVNYLCIGADTEARTGSTLSSMNTFYVQGDVSVSINHTVSIRTAIMGGGIVDVPSILWNGEEVTAPAAKNVDLDAPSTVISTDRCFFTSSRSQSTVYQFSSFKYGDNPRTKSISTDVYISGRGTVPVYGEGGIWESSSSLTIPMAYHLYSNTRLSVASGAVLLVEKGSVLVNSGHMLLSGTLDVQGSVINTGVVEKRDGGTIEGEGMTGDGLVAYCINVNPSGDVIDVMASGDDAVVLRTDSTVYVSHISVLLMNAQTSVVIDAPDTMYIGGSEFIIGLSLIENEDGTELYRLTIDGIDPAVLSMMEITVGVPQTSSQTVYAYRVSETGDYVPMEVLDTSYGEITFIADGAGDYIISDVSPDGIAPDEGSWLTEGRMNILLAAAIVLVGAAVVVILLRKDRGGRPS